MKRLLSLLFLLLSIFIYSQPPSSMPPISVCDPNNDGFEVFDLTTQIPAILNGLNPATTTVNFHETLTGAETNTAVISNPGSYAIINPFVQTIYISVYDSTNGQQYISSIDLRVNPTPAANPATLSFCDMMELAIYDLHQVDAQILNGATGSFVTYYETLTNAQAQSSPIVNSSYVPLINPGTQTLYATVTNASTGCLAITTLTLNTHNCGSCPVPTSLINSNVTFNSVVLNWTENGNATAWEILVLPAGFPAPTASATGFISASTFPFTLTGLTSATSYDLYVRSVCSATNRSDWSGLTTLTTSSAPPFCGGNFVDQGGVSANYSNNSNSTIIICPENAGEALTVTFTSFNTEISQDALYVYNGVNIGVSQISSTNPAGNVPGGLAGGYWGSTIPGPFTSTTQDGCLTFVFRSDAANTFEGWNANVTCTPVVCQTPTNLTISNVTNTTAILNWTLPFGQNASEVLIVPQGSPTPTTNSSGMNVSNNPSFTITGLTEGGCYTAYVRALCSSTSEWSSPVDFCMFNCENNAECAESLVLIAFLDSNNNGVKDVGETNFNYGNYVYQVNDSGNNQYGTSNNGSYYIFDANPTNSYNISFAVFPDLTTYYTSGVLHNDITLATGSGSHTLYFPIVNILPYTDAQVNLSPSGQPRPGFVYSNYIYYQNNGLLTIANGTLTFTKASNISITSISQVGTTPTANGFTYDFTNLGPFESRYIQIDFAVPTIPTVNLGDLVTNSVSVQIANDINLSNNSASLTQTVVGSYDPNNKIESHGGKIVHSTFTSNDYLYYTIQFENTGNANADFVRVEDALDSQLDENTFEMLSASHNVNTKRVGNQLTWHFYNINLPSTSSNPNGSHGYVSFKIKPKAGFAIGDIIPNTASIYFDYNPAIVTNRFNTEFVQTLSTENFDLKNLFSLSPVPAKNTLTITAKQNVTLNSVNIYNIMGQLVKVNTNPNETIDVSSLKTGTYLIKIFSDNGTATSRFIKE